MLRRYQSRFGKPRRDKGLAHVSIEKGVARGDEFDKTLQEQLIDFKLDLEEDCRNPLNIRYAQIGRKYITS